MAEAPSDKKGQDASRKGKKKRRRDSRKKSRKDEPQQDAEAQRGNNASPLPKGKERAEVGRAENLAKAEDIANPNDPAKLTELRPSLLELRESFRKTAPKHQIDSAIRTASKASIMASALSQAASAGPSTPGKHSGATTSRKSCDMTPDWRLMVAMGHQDSSGFQLPPSRYVSVSKEKAGGRARLRTLRNIMGGQSLAYCVVALVVLALAVLAVILSAILNWLYAKKREVSPSSTAITNPPRHVKGVVGMEDRRERTAPTVP